MVTLFRLEIYNRRAKLKQIRDYCFRKKNMCPGAAIIGQQICKGYNTFQILTVLSWLEIT